MTAMQFRACRYILGSSMFYMYLYMLIRAIGSRRSINWSRVSNNSHTQHLIIEIHLYAFLAGCVSLLVSASTPCIDGKSYDLRRQPSSMQSGTIGAKTLLCTDQSSLVMTFRAVKFSIKHLNRRAAMGRD